MSHLSYLEAVVMGAVQGISELFPISSLGHSVILPAIIGGTWAKDLSVTAPHSPYLSFIVGLHVATAIALLVFFWRDWVRIIAGLVTSIRYRRVRTSYERLAWLLILATIPVGIAGLLLDHLFRTVLGRPEPAAALLILNGVLLILGEVLRRRVANRQELAGAALAPDVVGGGAARAGSEPQTRREAREAFAAREAAERYGAEDGRDESGVDAQVATLGLRRGVLVGATQILALLPGLSRSGLTMVAGMAAGLTHRESARFGFLLATPVILAAGVLKLPDLLGPTGHGILGPVLAGSVASFVMALLAVGFLDRYFTTRTLTPFAIYCLIAGGAALTVFAIR